MIFGRDTELAALNAAFAQMLDGRGSVMFLTGEAGLGKTTLVREWWNGARASGPPGARASSSPNGVRASSPQSLRANPEVRAGTPALLLESACSIPIGNTDVGALEALQPWADVVACLDRNTVNDASAGRETRRGRLDIKRLVHDAAPSWAWALPFVGDIAHAAFETSRLIKEQRTELSQAGSGTNNPNAANQQQVFQQYVNLLVTIAAEQPLVIFLDDMHWADASSTNLLFYLSRQVPGTRILVIAAYRADDALVGRTGERHPILTVKNEILRYDAGAEIPLGALGISAIRSLLRQAYPDYVVDDRFERWLTKISDGNALFVTQYLKTLREDARLDDHGAFTGDYQSISIPASARAVIEERAQRLDEATRDLLSDATVEGEEFTLHVLQRLTGMSAPDLLKALQHAVRQGLISERGKTRAFANMSTPVFAFSHALLHQALYESMMDARRDYLHQQCLELFKTEWERAPATTERAATLASKLLTHAEKCEEWETAAAVALEAARVWWQSFAEREAMEMLEKALHAIDRTGTPLHAERGEALALRGNIDRLRGRYEAATAAFAAAIEAFDACRQTERAVDAALVRVDALHAIGEYGAAMTAAEAVLARAESLEYLTGIAGALNAIGIIHRSRGEYDQAIECHTRSLDTFSRAGNRAGMADARNNIGTVFMYRSDYASALEQYTKSHAIYAELGNRVFEAGLLINIGIIHAERGAFDDALTHFEKGLDRLHSFGNRIGEAMALNNIGSVHQNRGALDSALEFHERSLAIREGIGDRAGVAMSMRNIGGACRGLGQLARAREALDQAEHIFAELGARDNHAIVLCEQALLLESQALTESEPTRAGTLHTAIARMEDGLHTLLELKSRRAQKYAEELERMKGVL